MSRALRSFVGYRRNHSPPGMQRTVARRCPTLLLEISHVFVTTINMRSPRSEPRIRLLAPTPPARLGCWGAVGSGEVVHSKPGCEINVQLRRGLSLRARSGSSGPRSGRLGPMPSPSASCEQSVGSTSHAYPSIGRHLIAVLGEFADHYETHRPHWRIGQVPPSPPAPTDVGSATPAARVVRADRLGGPIHAGTHT